MTDFNGEQPVTDQPDTLYSTPWQQLGQFRFDEAVAQVFPDMIRRSVPGYGHVVGLSGLIAKRFAQPETYLYDIGCSLGATTLALATQVTEPRCRIGAIDPSQAMLAEARRIPADTPDAHIPIDWIEADARDYAYAPCSVVTLNFTLQFIPIEERLALLTRLAEAMVPGGCLILAEKTCVQEPDSQQVLTDVHHDFKRANGYSELEIAQKRASIENFLIPETEEAHIARLKAAGFHTVTGFFYCLNFRGWMAQV